MVNGRERIGEYKTQRHDIYFPADAMRPIVKPKSKSEVQSPSPKFKIQSPEERDWDWG